MAPGQGFEPWTNGLHRFLLFPDGMDYIFARPFGEGVRRFRQPCGWSTPLRDSL